MLIQLTKNLINDHSFCFSLICHFQLNIFLIFGLLVRKNKSFADIALEPLNLQWVIFNYFSPNNNLLIRKKTIRLINSHNIKTSY